jgi:hypothetical protein
MRGAAARAWSGALLAAVLIATSACGGSEAKGGEGPDVVAVPADVESSCVAECGFEQRCRSDTDDPAACVDRCLVGKFGMAARNMRSDATRAYGSCFTTLDCSGRDDDCEDAALRATGVNPETLDELPDVRACLDRDAVCPATDESIRGYCRSQVLFVTSARNELMSCLELPCEHVYGCMTDAFYGG